MSSLDQREDRQLEGIELDRRFVDHVSGKTFSGRNGVYTGRPATLKGEVLVSLLEKVAAGEKPSDLAREFKVSRMTLHRYKTRAACTVANSAAASREVVELPSRKRRVDR